MLGVALLLVSCSISKPPAPPTSKLPATSVMRFIAYAKEDAVRGYFTLADVNTNQVASAGELHLHLYTTTLVSLGGGDATTGMPIKTTLYDGSFVIGKSNFHWESSGSMVQVNDLACKFAIPYSTFKRAVKRGKVATLRMEFRVQGTDTRLEKEEGVALY